MYDRTESVGKLLTVRNANYKADIQYMTRISSYILTPIGIWPAFFERVGRFISTILIVLCTLALCFALVPFLLHTLYEEQNVFIQMELFGLFSLSSAAFVKFLILALRRSLILQCIKQLQEDWKFVECQLDREAMLEHGRVGRNLAIMCISLLYTGAVVYHLTMPFEHREKGPSRSHNHTFRKLYPTYAGFLDSEASPAYQLILVMQLFAEYVMYAATAGGYSLVALFVTHACGQLEVVISHLKDLVDGDIFEDSSDVDVRLKTIVQQHLRVLRFASMIERMLQEVCLVEFVASAILIGLPEYYCGMEWRDRNVIGFISYFLFIMSLTFNIFIMCYIGEQLTEKTIDIGETCCTLEWYRLPIETARGLILIMGMSSNPAKITAGGIVDLSIATFGNVLKTSVVYYSFLRTTLLQREAHSF